jgi:hypothetical protein
VEVMVFSFLMYEGSVRGQCVGLDGRRVYIMAHFADLGRNYAATFQPAQSWDGVACLTAHCTQRVPRWFNNNNNRHKVCTRSSSSMSTTCVQKLTHWAKSHSIERAKILIVSEATMSLCTHASSRGPTLLHHNHGHSSSLIQCDSC